MAHGDILVSVRNNLDSAWQSRQIARPASGDLGLFLFPATPGDPVAATLGDGFTYDDITGVIDVSGSAGADGKSAYEVAIDNGFVGTESEWLESLVGPSGEDGQDGADGKSAFQIAQDNGFTGTEAEWLSSLKGETGAAGFSAYQVAVNNGFTGTDTAWLASLKGEKGDKGDDGTYAEVSISGSVTRSFNSSFKISIDRNAFVVYSIQMTTAIALVSASASATAELQYSVDGSSWVKVSQAKMRRTTGLSVTIGEENEIETTVSEFIPANCFVRIATSTAGAGTASITYLSGQEVLV